MPSSLNQYYQLFFDFLDQNEQVGHLVLLAEEHQDSTLLRYDSNDKYVMQDEDFLSSLPSIRLYGTVAQEWWHLMAVYGHVREHAQNRRTDAKLSFAERLAQAAVERARHAIPGPGRWAQLQPLAEQELHHYLAQQLPKASRPHPAQIAHCQQLSELHDVADDFAEVLNERLQRKLLEDLRYRLRFETAGQPYRKELHLLHTCPYSDSEPRDYLFGDGVASSNVQPHHLRPISFAGAWISLPADEQVPMPVTLSFTDSREQTTAALNQAQSEQLTAQWCLEKGYHQLTLNPNVRQLVEAFGKPVAGQPELRWLDNGQLLTDLSACYVFLHPPVDQDTHRTDDALPF